jgi:hypothetical protein
MERPDFLYLRPRMPCAPKIDAIRNSLAMQALEADCTHLLMMDTDQKYPVDTVTRLLEHVRNGHEIVGAKVHRRYPPFDPLLLKRDPERQHGYNAIPASEWNVNGGGLIEVDATGTGCILIATEVFDVLEYPWFQEREKILDGNKSITIGEDIGFCETAKDAGYRIVVDTTIKIGHIADLMVTEETHFLYCQLEKMKRTRGNG